MTDLRSTFVDALERLSLVARGMRVAVGYSGGRDSTCLLHLFSEVAVEWELSIVAVMVDHRLRPFDEEEATAGRLCARLGIRHELVRLEPGLPDRAKAKGLSLEHAARLERREALVRAAAAANAQRIALAHHAGDQAETLLMRLLRGTGGAGLAGMRPVSAGGIIRPLLYVEPSQVARYLQEAGLEYVEDPTNRSQVFLRNRIRHEVLPLLEELSPGAARVLARSALVLGEERDAVNVLLDEKLADAVRWEEDGVAVVTIPELGTGALRRLLLHRVFEKSCRYPPESTHFEMLDNLLNETRGSGSLDLPGGGRAIREYTRLRIVPPEAGEDEAAEFLLELPGPGTFDFPGGKVDVRLVDQRGELPREDSPVAVFSASDVVFPLYVRQWRRGDRFQPLGVAGTSKVSDVLVDRKVPREQRKGVLVLTDRDGAILWVVGVRRSGHWKALPGAPAVVVAFPQLLPTMAAD